MRVLFVTNRHPQGDTPGESPCVEQQRQALRRLGHDVDLLFINSQRSRWNYLRAIGQTFARVQLRGGYDIVHAHYGYSGLPARFQWRCPVVVTYRGSDVLSEKERPVSKIVSRLADKSIVMTEDMKTLLGDEEAEVIPYGIDFDLFRPIPQQEARAALGLPAESPLVLFPYDPAREVKRFDLVEQAMERLSHVFPEARLLAVWGKPHEEVVQYMNACDVMVLASNWEGAPVAVREAMACNLPIVSVDVGDVASIIGNTEGCYICERSAESIADHLRLVLERRERTTGRDAVREFDLNHSARRVAETYAALLGQERPTVDPAGGRAPGDSSAQATSTADAG